MSLTKAILIINAKKKGWTDEARKKAAMTRKRKAGASKPEALSSIPDKKLKALYKKATNKFHSTGGSLVKDSREKEEMLKYRNEIVRRVRVKYETPVNQTPVKARVTSAPKMTGGPVSKSKHVHSILQAIASDNGNRVRKDAKLPANAKLLEQQAKKLSTAEKETLAAGEHREQQAIVKKYKVKELQKFLNEAFDGKYSSAIFHSGNGD